MAYSKPNILHTRKPSAFSLMADLLAIMTLISGVLGLALCVLSVLTSKPDTWLPFALITSMLLTVVGFIFTARLRGTSSKR